ncbi:sugar ABC transporter substrate-binding protein [Nocardioides sp. LHG3406-4]|uniref:sugar ABC transporter substrate-binding protein n=1 Tax=Nocardioides sp. LHG3406-4 TaxID=2804575 RepID=UPI003CF29CEC
MKLNRISTAVVLATLLALGACSTAEEVRSGNDEGSQSRAEEIAAELEPSDLKIAFFSSATNNTYLQAGIDGVKQAADEIGASVDVFDGKFDAQVQFDQIQSALTSGKYNAFVVEANDGNLLCDILTQDAPKQGVLVSTMNQPICGRATNAGDELWEPGTVTFVGGQTLDVYQAWIESIMSDNPDGGQVAVISGPDLGANTINLNEALGTMEEDPSFEIVANQKTDYSTPQGFDAAQTILQANKNLDIIISNYSGMTQGVVEAVKAGNRLNDVRVYDMGGDKWAIDAVKRGDLAQSVIFLPELEGYTSVKAIGDFVTGKEVEKFINLTESDTLPGTPFVSKDNFDQFDPEY